MSNNVVCATSKASDQPAHTRSLIRVFDYRLNILWMLSYWLEHHLEFLRLKGGCTGSSESTLVKVLTDGNHRLNIVVIDNFALNSFQFNIDFVIFGSFLRFKCYQQPRHHFAYQWLDNVKINKYAKFDPTLPCGSRVLSIYTNWPRLAGLMAIKKGCCALLMPNLIKIYQFFTNC